MDTPSEAVTPPSGSRITRPLFARLSKAHGLPLGVSTAQVAPKHTISEPPRMATAILATSLGVTASALGPGLHGRAFAPRCGERSMVTKCHPAMKARGLRSPFPDQVPAEPSGAHRTDTAGT